MFVIKHKKITPAELAAFFRQLATLINAGIPILQGLEILSKSTHHLLFKKLLESIQSKIKTGHPLSVSLRMFTYPFDAFTCYLIYVGEQSGTLPVILKRIADHKEKTYAYQKQLQQALLYPTTVLSIAIIILFIMLIFIVPRFAEIFASMHGTLPPLTLFVIQLSRWLRSNYDLLFCLLIVLAYFKNHFIHLFWQLPIIGPLYQKNGLAHFAQTLAVTLKAGIAITDALQIMMHAPHLFYAKSIPIIYQEINKGESLYKTLLKASHFPELMVQMVKVGEESGNLEEMLEKTSELFTAEVDHFLKNLNHLLEPLIMVVLGVLIGGLVIAMYLPIFKLGAIM